MMLLYAVRRCVMEIKLERETVAQLTAFQL